MSFRMNALVTSHAFRLGKYTVAVAARRRGMSG
jgi:hypothetical protein